MGQRLEKMKTIEKVQPVLFDRGMQVVEHTLTEDSVPHILTRLNILIDVKWNPSDPDSFSITEENLQVFIKEAEMEQVKLRSLLIQSIIDYPLIGDKRQYIQIVQTLVIRLLDKLYSYQQAQKLCNKMLCLYEAVSQHLQHTLSFMEDLFSNYFNRNEKVPVPYLFTAKEEIKKGLRKLISAVDKHEAVDKKLVHIISQSIQQFISDCSKDITYIEFAYLKNLLTELLPEKTISSTKSIREMLYYLNFNEENFIIYEYERLQQLTENLTRKEKVTVLRTEQKNINQLLAKLNCEYSASIPSLKHQVNKWIDEEIKFLEFDNLPEKIADNEKENETKIHTSISVAKLALFIRLLVIDKIIINRTIAPMLRIAGKVFTTLQKDDISFGSLETKYHAPDKATINAVKDMLFKWINILNRL